MRHCCRLAVLALGVALVPGARADDVTDQINEALKAYQNHDTQTAIAALDAAANLLRQARAESLKKLLPPTPPGWSADEAQSTTVGVAMLGGGITASRAYHNGNQRVEVQIVTDSPVLQGLGALIGSPLATIGGMKTAVIGGRRMSYTESDHSYMTVVADKVIVRLEGNADTPDATLKSFIGAIDFTGIERLAH
jgi:hypothetical protein